MAFQDDLAWFEANRAFISQQYAGQYVVIRDKAVVGAYPDYGTAASAAAQMFGNQSIVVKQALPQEPARMI